MGLTAGSPPAALLLLFKAQKVGQLVYQRDEESICIKVPVDGDPCGISLVGRAEVARLGVALAGDPEMDPARFKVGEDNRGRLLRDAWQEELLYNGKGRDRDGSFGSGLAFWLKEGQSQFFLCL